MKTKIQIMRIATLAVMMVAYFTASYSQTFSDSVLVWSDEFNTPGITLPNDSSWGYDAVPPGTYNHEAQNYTYKRLENTRVRNGYLVIQARNDNYQGYPISSGRLSTAGKRDWLYGRVVVNAKLPINKKGTWPAIWMLPTDWIYGGWPNSGELDIMEEVGYDPNVIHASAHSNAYNVAHSNQKTAVRTISDCTTAFHDYIVEWTPSSLNFYIDAVLYLTFNNENQGWTKWPYNQRNFLILNLAIGGDWGGVQGIDYSQFPDSMSIDYVRVYKYNAPVDVTPPTAPTALAARPSSYSIGLTWTASIDNFAVKRYEVYSDTLIDSTIFSNFTIANLTPETDYNFKVRAIDYAGNASDFDSISTATTQVNSTPVNTSGNVATGSDMEDSTKWTVSQLTPTSPATVKFGETNKIPSAGTGGAMEISCPGVSGNSTNVMIWQSILLKKGHHYFVDAAYRDLGNIAPSTFWAQWYVNMAVPVDGQDYLTEAACLLQFNTWGSCGPYGDADIILSSWDCPGKIKLGETILITKDTTYTFGVKIGTYGYLPGYDVVIDYMVLLDLDSAAVSVNQSTIVNAEIYPNPAHNQISISTDMRQYRIYIMSPVGQTVKEFNDNSALIDIQDLKAGFYFIVLRDNQQNIVVKKFIKE
jgi:beta-glucanase (GH16 family)